MKYGSQKLLILKWKKYYKKNISKININVSRMLIRCYQQFRRGINMPECLLDVCDINHSGVEDYTPNIFSNISREYHGKEVDKAKGINSNFNSEFYCIQDNY